MAKFFFDWCVGFDPEASFEDDPLCPVADDPALEDPKTDELAGADLTTEPKLSRSGIWNATLSTLPG